MAYYQTNPTTQGAISVTHIHSPEDIEQVQPVACPPLLHLVWGRSLLQPDTYILAAASRTNDVLIYSYEPSSKTLLLVKTINIEENIFCLYLDLLSL